MNSAAQHLSEIPWLWVGARSTGIAAWVAASVTVVLGLTIRTGALSKVTSARNIAIFHGTAALTTVVLTGMHIVFLLLDSYAKVTVADVFVPWMSLVNDFGRGLGSVAFVILLAVTAASLVRTRMNAAVWKVVHICAYVVWPLATVHFIVSGTDARATAAVIGIVTVLAVIDLLVIMRGYLSRRRNKRNTTRTAGSTPRSRQLAGVK